MGLPGSVTLAQVCAVLIPVAIVTLVLRQTPYSAKKLLRNNFFVGTLAFTMPVGVMVVLVAYTLLGTRDAPGGVIASGLAVLATLGLHAWRRNAGLSILGGTAVYMVLVNVVFAG